MADELNVTDGRPAGAFIGQSASEKIGFYGTTPIVQATFTATVTTTPTTTTLKADLAALVTDLQNLGLIA